MYNDLIDTIFYIYASHSVNPVHNSTINSFKLFPVKNSVPVFPEKYTLTIDETALVIGSEIDDLYVSVIGVVDITPHLTTCIYHTLIVLCLSLFIYTTIKVIKKFYTKYCM